MKKGIKKLAEGGETDPYAIELSGEDMDDIESNTGYRSNLDNKKVRNMVSGAKAFDNQKNKGKTPKTALDAGQAYEEYLNSKESSSKGYSSGGGVRGGGAAMKGVGAGKIC